MKVGLILPTFREDPNAAIEAAVAAEAAGLDGVFVYDHLWPIGAPERPALHGPTMLGAVAAETSRVHIGTLVARVSLLPEAVLANGFATVARIAGKERVLAGLGTGDKLSRAENEAYGVAFPPLEQRIDRLADACRRLRAEGIQTWVGGRAPAVRRAAAQHADGLNMWGVSADDLAAAVDDLIREVGGRAFELTWGGTIAFDSSGAAQQPDVLAGTPAQIIDELRARADVGASWAVCGFTQLGGDDVKRLSEVAEALR